MSKKLTDWDKMVIADLAKIERRIASGDEKTYSLDDTLKYMDKVAKDLHRKRSAEQKKRGGNVKTELVPAK